MGDLIWRALRHVAARCAPTRGKAGVGALVLAIASLWLAVGRATADDDGSWELEVSERLELTPGSVGTATVVLRGRGRATVARSGLLLDLTPSSSGISVRQRRYQRADAAEPDAAEPRFSVPVRADAAGSYALEVRARFWICTPKSCRPIDERRSIAVEVRAPAPPDAGPVDGAAPEAPAPRPRVRPRR